MMFDEAWWRLMTLDESQWNSVSNEWTTQTQELFHNQIIKFEWAQFFAKYFSHSNFIGHPLTKFEPPGKLSSGLICTAVVEEEQILIMITYWEKLSVSKVLDLSFLLIFNFHLNLKPSWKESFYNVNIWKLQKQMEEWTLFRKPMKLKH